MIHEPAHDAQEPHQAAHGLAMYRLSSYRESLSILHQLMNALKGSSPQLVHGLIHGSASSSMGSVCTSPSLIMMPMMSDGDAHDAHAGTPVVDYSTTGIPASDRYSTIDGVPLGPAIYPYTSSVSHSRGSPWPGSYYHQEGSRGVQHDLRPRTTYPIPRMTVLLLYWTSGVFRVSSLYLDLSLYRQPLYP